MLTKKNKMYKKSAYVCGFLLLKLSKYPVSNIAQRM